MGVPEDELLEHVYARSAQPVAGVIVGPGDDAAVIEIGARGVLLTTDQLIAGRHVDLATTPIELVGRKAIARCLSDIAAMGGAPVAALAAAALPADFEQADALFDAMRAWALTWGCPLAGGDIAATPGPLALTVSAIGAPHPTRGAVLRSGARPGDGVYVTGAVGASLATGWHVRFQPRLAEARALCDALGESLHAMIDISDGLGKDAARVARASHVRLEIDAPAIPLRDAHAIGWRDAASEGEDYELLFTASSPPPARLGPAESPVSRIGVVVEANSEEDATCVLIDDAGAQHDARDMGWEHRA